MRSFHDKLADRIARAPRVFFFLDYDGTLASIAKKPEQAILKQNTRFVLRSLTRLPGIQIAVVSGRALADLQSKVGSIPGVIYVGNHGLEVKEGDWSWRHPSASRISEVMERLWRRLNKKLRPVKGMLLENKKVGISLHYRLVPEGKVADLYRRFQAIIEPWIRPNLIRLQEGKKVWEIRPKACPWNKGSVIKWLLKRNTKQGGFLPVFIGDDKTDEDAFRVLRKSGITVKVTENPRAVSAAKYYIHSPEEVSDFLERILKIRRSRFKVAR